MSRIALAPLPSLSCEMQLPETRPSGRAGPDRSASIDRPHARRGQLEEVAVGIAKVYALAASRPRLAVLDPDTPLVEPGDPAGKGVGRHAKREVLTAGGVVRCGRARRRRPPQADEQHLPAGDAERTQPLIGPDRFESEEL